MQQYRDGCSPAHFTFHLYIAVMQINQLFGQVHSDTGSRRIGIIEFVITGEALKEHISFLRRDTDTFILNGKRHEAGLVGDNHANMPAGRCELKCIAQ